MQPVGQDFAGGADDGERAVFAPRGRDAALEDLLFLDVAGVGEALGAGEGYVGRVGRGFAGSSAGQAEEWAAMTACLLTAISRTARSARDQRMAVA